ncbi:hypothetical protein [Streptomyces meridianus]|uniref:Uncharacterized protein n=1 Tax=Streptomyces meridianus TaxID=2938945 RepID=A0ABT0XC49_9ACTN|nr:hypothetical protein [Streptomyces meridianus]MCM2579840.1 hypothetical protein [Streptomyces meridianus]
MSSAGPGCQVALEPLVAPADVDAEHLGTAVHNRAATRNPACECSRCAARAGRSVSAPVPCPFGDIRLFDRAYRIDCCLQGTGHSAHGLGGVLYLRRSLADVLADLDRPFAEAVGGLAVPGLQDLVHGLLELLLNAVLTDELFLDGRVVLADFFHQAGVGSGDHRLELFQPHLVEARVEVDTPDRITLTHLSAPISV